MSEPIYASGEHVLEPTPRQSLPHATLTGVSFWGEPICLDLRDYKKGLMIGRKMPNVHLDLSNYTPLMTVSHNHCRIFYNALAGMYQIENLGRNGTRLNDRLFGRGNNRESVIYLQDGDVITIGALGLVFHLH